MAVRSLFSDSRLSEHLDALLAQVPVAVDRLDAAEIRDNAPIAAQKVIEALAPKPLSIDLTHPKTEPFETSVNRRNDFTGQEDQLPAVGVSAFVPYTGSPKLFSLRPASSESGWWPQGDVTAGSVRIEVVASHLDAEQARTTLQDHFQKLQHYVDYVNADLGRWMPSLGQKVREAVGERSSRLKSGDDLRGLFD